MNQIYRDRSEVFVGVQSAGSVLARFMNGVYAWMCVGLCITGIAALLTVQSGVQITGGLMIILIVIELGLVMMISGMTSRLSASAATGLFLLYSALNGVTLSVLFLVYTQASIAGAFLITAGMFGVMSFYGMVTKRDLSSLGSLLFMGVLGLIIASIVNVFVASSALYWLISYAGVAIFVGLTAYDTQRLKELANSTAGNPQLAARLAVNGSLILYLDFINLLLFILRILGDKRR